LKAGFDGISEVPAERWDIDAYYSADREAPGKMYVRSGGFLADIDRFDAAFFGISPREAVRMHPQQRLLLEVAWEALENAGQSLEKAADRKTGVFLGFMQTQDYAQLQVQASDSTYMDDPYYGIGNSASITSGRISYIFDFQGPNLAIDTACSSSLVATHLACQSLRRGECNQALVGGVNINLLPENTVNACKMHMLSQEGRCKTFDASADGFVIGEGCGVVVLKRLSDALADQDTILAVIRGSAVNQDGRSNGLTAPNKLAQEAVITQALADAGIESRQVSYVEAHGSATSLGDPIEIEALAKTLGQTRTSDNPLMIGSVKTNIGHLAGAAGIAGLIKTVLALQYKEIPPHLHLKEPNPYIHWDTLPVVVPTACMAWPNDGAPRIAGVSSFGWSGTNAHILLEEAPPTKVGQTPRREDALLLLSAKTEAALEQATDNLLLYLKQNPALDLADVAYTSQVGRHAFPQRRMLICKNLPDLVSALERRDTGKILTARLKENYRSLIFLFPGELEHVVEGTAHLYQQEPVFREWVDTCCELLPPRLAHDIRKIILQLYRPDPGVLTSAATNTATFVIDYALARLLLSWGIHPEAMLGHNSGEYVAACLAGVFSLEHALLFVTRPRDVELPMTTLLNIPFHEPQIPYISNVTGTWTTREQAVNPEYWMRHSLQPLTFTQDIEQLLQGPEHIFLEVGSGQKLGFLLQQHSRYDGTQSPLVFACLPDRAERTTLLTIVGRLWLAGISVNWQGFSAQEKHVRVMLPTYPFERQRYWIETESTGQQVPSIGTSLANTQEQLKREKLEDWCYFPGWKSSSAYVPFTAQRDPQAKTGWICFLDELNLGNQLMQRLRQQYSNILIVTPGQTFQQSGQHTYTIHPASPGQYELLFKSIRTEGYSQIHILHLWTLTDPQQSAVTCAKQGFETTAQKGFYSVLALIQALEHLQFDACHITLLSNGIYDVPGNEVLYPEKATMLGPCLAVPFEYSAITCRCIDIAFPVAEGWPQEELLSTLLGEITSASPDTIVALRGNRRWTPAIERFQLARQTTPDQVLRKKGVYLITGGLGGIGLAMAEYLARTVSARLVLVGRSSLPPREEWAQTRQESKLSFQLQAIKRMEALGAEVLILQADVTDIAQMQRVIQQTLTNFGALHGVLHAAGVPGMGLLQLKTAEQAAKVLAPKVQGTLVLDQVLAPLALDFLVLFSSITSTTGGGPGQVDYAAANAFLDAYAWQNRHRHGKTLAIDWGEWQWNAWEEGLTGYNNEIQHFLREHRQRFGILFAEGTEVFGRLLASNQSRVIVSTQDVQKFMEFLQTFSATRLGGTTQSDQHARPVYPRPALASSYTPARNKLEQDIISLWEELLGTAPVGIYDNFFELGGNSLIGINLIARMRKTLLLEALPTYALYEAPSVSDLAQYIRQGQEVVIIKERQERGEKRRADLAQRLETMRRRK
ncbi:MAG TPA: SDR family NAD(P)-dependent oxidoreductase, partial [Ktedonobacteraceae bacterium]|nr:SDR family NAD(P)-dependent oxidoreductase [Ktedonobacteraceae bacterium]